MSKDRKIEIEDLFPILLMGGLFVLVDGLTLLLTSTFEASGVSAFENPNDPLDLVYIFLTLLLSTAAILAISRFHKRRRLQGILLEGIFLGAMAMLCFDVFYSLMATAISESWSLRFSVAATAALTLLLIEYPEWYVVDACGILVGVGAIAMIGISLSISLVIILLIGMAIYDAISVYKTKHMIDLADTVLRLRVPVMLVVPKIKKYSLIKQTRSLKEKLKDEERDAFFIGLGDIVFPGILVISAYSNITSGGLVIASSVILGTLIGFSALMVSVVKGKPQAGLPYLCSGAILGYLVSSLLLFGKLVGLAFM